MRDISPKNMGRTITPNHDHSHSIADEVEAERRKSRHPMRKAFIALGAVLLLSGGAYAFLGNHQTRGDTLDASTNSPPMATTTTPSPSATPLPSPTAPVDIPAPQSSADREAAIATSNRLQVCQMMLKTAIATSSNYNKMFIDGWNSWGTAYAGQYDSQAAQIAKQWDKDYIKKLYSDYFNANGATFLKTCYPSTTTLADIMDQPNYDAW